MLKKTKSHHFNGRSKQVMFARVGSRLLDIVSCANMPLTVNFTVALPAPRNINIYHFSNFDFRVASFVEPS